MSLGLALLAAVLPSVACAGEPRLRGDAEAVTAVERMLERLGGREVWARGRTVHSQIEGWHTTPKTEPVIAREWWDLTQPRKRTEHGSGSSFTLRGLSPSGSWSSRDEVVTRDDDETHRWMMESYPYWSFPSLHALAVADPRFTLQWAAPHRVILRSADGRERAWWDIDQTGAPIGWGTTLASGNKVQYVYGPVRAFGTVNFPAWGAASDGSFRFDWTELSLTTQAMVVSVDAPGSSPDAQHGAATDAVASDPTVTYQPRSGFATDDRERVRAPLKAIHCGRLLDVRARQTRSNVTVLIEGDRVMEIRNGRVRPANADAIVDLRDQVCAPGIMDMHLHLTSSFVRRGETHRPQDPYHYTVSETALGLAHARETLYSGVTSIRSPGEFLPNRASVYINEAIENWEHVGPRIFLASHHIGYDYARRPVVAAGDLAYERRITNGLSYDRTEPGGDVRQAVRNATSQGEEWVKVSVDVGGPLGRMKHVRLWSFEELRVMADEAHRRGRRITGHIETDEAARDAVLAGFDSIEHAFAPSRATLDLMRERNVYWSTTLADLTLAYDPDDPLLGSEELPPGRDLTAETADRDAAFRYAYSIGVPMVYASDGIFMPGTHRGRMVLEFSQYLALGVTPWDLLTIATLNPAAMLGESKNLGSIDPGKYADIIALPRNPLDDITAFNDVTFVMKGGNVVRDDLHRSPLPDVFTMQLPDVTYVVDPTRPFTREHLKCTGRDCNPQASKPKSDHGGR